VRPGSLDDLVAEQVISETDIEPARKLLAYLQTRNVVIAPDADLNSVYLQTLAKGPAASAGIGEYRVGMAGCGQVGRRIASHLASFGPGLLILADDRPPDHRQNGHDGGSQNGGEGRGDARSYVDVLRRRLRAGGCAAVEARSGSLTDDGALTDLFKSSDLGVAALDCVSPRMLHHVNSIAVQERKPWCSVYMDGSEAVVGPIYVPGETSCYLEFELQSDASVALRDEHFLYREYLEQLPATGTRPVLEPYADVAAGMASAAILQFLVRGQSFAVNRATRIDFERMSIDYQDVLRLPRCPACGLDRGAYRHVFM
jgi:bacteriocin biosynthesis cyclodehydratase domain-containing protein